MQKFDFNTIDHFDYHISSSINGYTLLDGLIMNICSFYAKKEETIIDLGCTSGRLISKLATEYPDSICIGFDITDNNFLTESKALLYKQDITEIGFELPSCNIVLSVFTLQFLKYAHRIKLLKKIYDALNPTGVFIICEKEIVDDGNFQEVFTFANYDYKKNNFTSEEILQKEYDLRKIMNCMSVGGNEKLFKEAGFTRLTSFFQSLNFKGWLCMK